MHAVQNNSHAKVAHLGEVCSEPLHPQNAQLSSLLDLRAPERGERRGWGPLRPVPDRDKQDSWQPPTLPSSGSEKAPLPELHAVCTVHSLVRTAGPGQAPCLASEGKMGVRKGAHEYRAVGLIRGAQRRRYLLSRPDSERGGVSGDSAPS